MDQTPATHDFLSIVTMGLSRTISEVEGIFSWKVNQRWELVQSGCPVEMAEFFVDTCSGMLAI